MDVLCRYAAVKLVKGEQKSITVSEKRVAEFLGHGIHHEKILENPVPGVVTGLAWTSAGGEILFIETSFTKGDGKVIITGQLGDVMKESAQIAITLVKSLYPEFADKFKENDLHIHVPAGAVPKDGPSAGITMTNCIILSGDRKACTSRNSNDRRSFPSRRCYAYWRIAGEADGCPKSWRKACVYSI